MDIQPFSHSKAVVTRGKIIVQATAIGILSNLLIALIKLVIGFVSNSVAVMSDAVNNVTDVLSSLTTLIGYKLGSRYPTRMHPLGYGRIEYISGMIVGIIIIIAGIEFLTNSLQRIFAPSPLHFSWLQIGILFLTIVVKVFLSRYNIRQGKLANSDALIASGKDAASDVFYSSVIVLSAIVMLLTGVHIDGYIGLLVSLMILWVGIKTIREILHKIIGSRPDKELTLAIVAEAQRFPPIQGGHDLIVHDYGPVRQIGNMTLEFGDNVSLEAAYNAMQDAQDAIYERFGIYFIFSFYCVTPHNAEAYHIIYELVESIPGGRSVHALHYEREQHFLRFDAVVDFTVQDCRTFQQALEVQVRKHFPTFRYEIHVEYDSIG